MSRQVRNNYLKEKFNDEFIPSEFYLSQNFPNPFRQTTNIKYCLPIKTKVNISVFNSEGIKIIELVNKIQEPGTYEEIFDGRDLPDGSYNYELQIIDPEWNHPNGNTDVQVFAKTKKMVLKRKE